MTQSKFGEWHSIKSAPKDKIIFLADKDCQSYYCRFHRNAWCEWSDQCWTELYFNPTHWMPLPEPPK